MDQPNPTDPGAKPPVHPDDLQLLKAFQSVTSSLPQLGALVLGIAAIGYFVGWRVASAYYREFGAEWVVSLLSPSELLQESYTVLSGIVSGVLGTMLLLLNRTWNKKLVERIDLATTLLGFLVLFVALFLQDCLESSSGAYVTLAAAFLLSVSISSSIILHVYAVRDQERAARIHLCEAWLPAVGLRRRFRCRCSWGSLAANWRLIPRHRPSRLSRRAARPGDFFLRARRGWFL